MKQFFKNNIGLYLTLFILLITGPLNAQENVIKLPFEEIDFSIGRAYRGKLIDSYKEAVKIGLCSETLEAAQFYKNHAVYLFSVGGGCFGATPNEISIELEKNWVKINWTEPKEPCPEVGEAMAFYGKIILAEKDHLNYKNLRFKYYWE